MTTATADNLVEALPATPDEVPPGPTYNRKLGWVFLALAALAILLGSQLSAPVPAKKADADKAAADAMIAEFEAEPYISIPKIGPIDLSITKPVLYMLLVAALCCAFAVWQANRMKPKPNRKQTFVEVMYEFLYNQVAKSTLPDSLFARYMPFLASVFLFIWLLNLVSFLPLPVAAHSFLGHEGGPGIRDLALYAATSNINVTLTLTLCTIILAHYLGIREHGPVKYLKTWAPPGGLGLKIFMWGIHALGEFVKVVSLSVRLFANMLTGHMLVLVMITIIFVMGNTLVGLGTIPIAIGFFLFEVILVATLQAYIFAVLSGSYMGMAASHDH
jgi:F-type H+-transporting ATPase subunit a